MRARPLPRLFGSIRLEVVVGLLASLIVLYLVAVPLAMLIFSSFRATGNTLPFEATTYTLANYVEVFTSSLTYRLLLNTVWYAAGSLVLGLGLGVSFSWLLERTNIPGRDALLVLIMTTLAVPGLVTSMAWIMIANPNNGIFNVVLRQVFRLGPDGPFDIYGVPGMILVTGFSLVPSMYIMISGLFSRMDPALEDAGAMNGAKFLSVIKRITAPLLKPGLLAAAIYYFVVVSEEFQIPALLGMSQRIFVFSTMIYQTTHPTSGLPNFGLASGYAMVQLLASGGLIYWYAQATRNRAQFSVIQGKGYRPRVIDLRNWKWVAFGGVLLYFTLTTLVPFLVLLWTSFQPFFSVPSVAGLSRMSWINYGKMLHLPGFNDAITNTILVGGVTAIATLLLGSIVSWMAVRKPFWWSAMPDRFSFLVVATPSIVMGLALMFIYLWVPLPIYGTIAILAIALTTRYLPFVVRLLSAALLQIHKELEEVAHMSGAGWPRTMRLVVVPLALPSVWRGILWVITHVIREATLSVMLFSTTNMTMGTMLWLAWEHYTDVGQAAALAVCMLLVSGVFTYFLARSGILGGHEPKTTPVPATAG